MKAVPVDSRVGTVMQREDSVITVVIGLEKVPLDM